MSFLLAALRKDLLARLADRAALAMWFGIPLILGGLMSLAFGGSSGPSPKAVVWLVDQDESFVSELLAGALDNPDMPLSVEPVELEDGSARIEDGQGSALIVIPAGFGQAVLEETPTELAITTNPAQTILPGIVTGLTDSLSEAHFYLHRLVGGPLQTMVDGPGAGNSLFPDPELIAMTLEINGIVSTLQDLLFPPLIEVTAAPLPPKQSEPVDPGTMLLPGIVLMSLMFIAQTMADELWAEHDAGTWSRLLTYPLGVGQLLLSKLLSGTIVMGSDVRISRVAVAQGNLTLRIEEAPLVVQPNPFSDGESVVVPRTGVAIEEEEGIQLAEVPETTSLSEVVAGLNALGVSPRDMIDILKSLKAAGALHAEFVVR